MALVEQVEQSGEGRRRLRLANPATLAPLGEIEVGAAADVHAAVERARKAQLGWADLSFEERGRYLQRVVRVILERHDEIVATISSETGKPPTEALATEVMTACDALHFYAKRARRILGERRVPLHLMLTKKLRVIYKPLGVVGIITPWNFPFVLALNPVAQALMAGNAIVLKPSEATPFSARLVEELFSAAGLPEGVLNVVLGDGETGAALVEADVDKIVFTGSVATGRRVAEACGRQLVPCTLELGGKDPMIVCADADLERAARGAVYGAFANSGQVCTSTERVYVVDEVADRFTQLCVDATSELRQGSTGEFDVGAIIWPQQLDTIEAHVADALQRGATLLTGGRRNPNEAGFYYEPTILTNVSHEMRVMRDETFGPLLPIMRVPDEAAALRYANDSRYGLNANVWTRNKHKGAEMARAIESGCVVVNDCMVTYAVTEAPFGGVKESGIGRVNGEMGLRGYCHAQSIVIDRFGGRSELFWYPYTRRKLGMMKRMLRLMWGTSLGRWLS
ncbi:MAG: aldehyde dehydrogenase family protein [Deltaproteobacteria bacterium]|nr:aldehyde dehydrogenase family protein [Deltaproteobacteria bacterium]MBW2359775.1 aldehyde dehydrogenase family protein [Deltaproteobacteria bacterium]